MFSQFTSFLDLIQAALLRERFDLYRYDGSMDIKKRNAALKEFKEVSRKPKVLIVSLKAGGVGLNVRINYLYSTFRMLIILLADYCQSCLHGECVGIFYLPLILSSFLCVLIVIWCRWIAGGMPPLRIKVSDLGLIMGQVTHSKPSDRPRSSPWPR